MANEKFATLSLSVERKVMSELEKLRRQAGDRVYSHTVSRLILRAASKASSPRPLFQKPTSPPEAGGAS